ncbi:hypothetical protein M5K25_003888 [Dendrobium thyrsiflorum]|uniref:Uncharacterized protein n=1 Tax=Dendrobium thyrsiflorum TaxID=117978 RepID=A0ABD0VS60_DENTH
MSSGDKHRKGLVKNNFVWQKKKITGCPSIRKRCWIENRNLLNCVVIPISGRRTSKGLMSEQGKPRSIHGFERARLQQMKILLVDQQNILTIIAALTVELEQVRKAQADWQMQMQQQIMREHLSRKNVNSADEETESE